MMIPGAMEGASGFSSMKDDFIEKRFDPGAKSEFVKKLEEFDTSHHSFGYEIPVTFIGSFDNRSQKALEALINEVFGYAEENGLKLSGTFPEVVLYTVESWHDNPENTPLKSTQIPAAKLIWELGLPKLLLIIPSVFKKTEALVKTARLVCSKIFGKLYFDEKIPLKPAFRNLGLSITAEVPLSIEEKARFCFLMEIFSDDMKRQFKLFSKRFQIKGERGIELGKKEFQRELFQSPPDKREELDKVVEGNFRFLLSYIGAKPEKFYDLFAYRVFSMIPQASLILPHEQISFERQKAQREWMLFHSLADRIQMCDTFVVEIFECEEFIQEVAKGNSIDFELAHSWKITLNQMVKKLKKRGLIKEYLSENVKLTENQLRKKKTFPLWAWQRGLISSFGKNGDPEKILKKLVNKYQNSIYQKICDASLRLTQVISSLEKKHTKNLSEITDYSRLKPVISWLKVRHQVLISLLSASQVGVLLSGIVKSDNSDKSYIVKDYEQAWSYFISFALLHQYYLVLDQRKGKNSSTAQQFKHLINEYVEERIETESAFKTAGLFLEFYEKSNFDLEKIILLIAEDSPTLEFFVLNQAQIFKSGKKSVKEIIHDYAKSLYDLQNKNL